jgi:hypothetical protein
MEEQSQNNPESRQLSARSKIKEIQDTERKLWNSINSIYIGRPRQPGQDIPDEEIEVNNRFHVLMDLISRVEEMYSDRINTRLTSSRHDTSTEDS